MWPSLSSAQRPLTGFRIAARIASLPQTLSFTGGGTFRHPVFGRLDSRGAYALVAFHLQLHVPQIRRSIAINGPS